MAGKLTPRRYAIASPDIAAAVGLEAREYGVLMCEREDGGRVTLVGDVDYTRTLIQAPPSVRATLEIPSERYPIERDGWPPEWEQIAEEIGGEA